MAGKILDQLEKIAYWLQKKYMSQKKTSELVSAQAAFFHPEDKTQKILTLYQIRFAQQLAKKVVLATGCFDILHQEHLKFLKKAKKEADLLVVGLEPDQRIKQLKGKNRPVNSWQKRAQNLLRIKEVGLVLRLPDNFGVQSVRRKILRLIKPDILAISAQDPLEEKKQKECQEIGCRLKIVHPYNATVSTSRLLKA